MAETIFAGKKIKEFSFKKGFVMFTSVNTVVPGFPKQFFMSECP